MHDERDHTEEEATSVNEPSGPAPDDDLAYDPAMTQPDEANIPPESEADPGE